jgi:hypothetical protein
VTGLDGRYNWDDGVDPARAAFLTCPGSVRYFADGETATAYVGLYTDDVERIGEVGVTSSDLPGPLDAVYRVTVADHQIVDLEHGKSVNKDWRTARTCDETSS